MAGRVCNAVVFSGLCGFLYIHVTGKRHWLQSQVPAMCLWEGMKPVPAVGARAGYSLTVSHQEQ